FIGSHICTRLIKEGYEVICLDNFDPYYDPGIKRKNIESLLKDKKFKLVEGDIRDEGLLQDALKGVDYVFHYAAQAGVRASVQNPLKTHEVNATGTLQILRACVKSNVKNLINASSSSVYGKVEYLPLDERHPTVPVSPYGVSKLLAEHYCRVFSEIFGLKVNSLRLFTVYGPRMRPDLAISIFTRAALKNDTIVIFGDGTKTRDFTCVDDVVEANLSAMEKANGGVFNIGGGNRISVEELAQLVIRVTGSSSKVVYSESQQADVEHTWANIEKARNDLGWEPKTKLLQGLERYADWVGKSELADVEY
ncbi:MAG: GDP-mannose 4,6-dehydratase, partial [Dehalococcoidia bacterium]|nr:GDP-mannose 4,6-dehydratase [Dehalococcoidia bacterium]